MIKRKMRRSWRKIEQKLCDARSGVTNLFRTNSNYQERPISVRSFNHSLSETVVDDDDDDDDGDDDGVFEAIDDPAPTTTSAEVETTSRTSIPCEFCNEQIADNEYLAHQASCQERTLSRNVSHRHSSRRMSPSESPNRSRGSRRPAPSAPPAPTTTIRERSPSPTEGFPIPHELICPITMALFEDPVVASDGHTYEREAIMRIIRQSGLSPITRQRLSVDKLIFNRLAKEVVDKFRAECKQKRDRYKYKIDVDLKKGEEITSMNSENKKVYLIEWIKRDRISNTILLDIAGDMASTLSDILCRIPVHPNFVRTFGRVENAEEHILLVQEYFPVQTLTDLLKKHEQMLTLPLLDMIFYQIACALQYLKESQIIFGDLTADDVLIYQLHNFMEQNHIKLTNVSNYLIMKETIQNDRLAPEVRSNRTFSAQSDVYSFGRLARQCYSSRLIIDEREILFQHCLVDDPNDRPSIDQIMETYKQWTDD